MPVIDLSFELRGASIPLDYGYDLFSALCRVVPSLHGDRRVGVHPIRGVRMEPRRLTLVRQSRLRLRLPSEEISPYLALAGRWIELDGSPLAIGIPRVEPLRPAVTIASRLVLLGHHVDPEPFLDSAHRQLAGLGVAAELGLVPSSDPARPSQPSRRVVRIKGRRVVGYAVCVIGLTAEESLTVQEQGLGSHRRMGCGVFLPLSGGGR
jgi:CRISPR-associated protein Cas6